MSATGAHPDDLLSARLDGELDPASARAVDRHLQDCESCRHELAATDEARRRLRAAPAVPPPSGLVGDLVRRRRRADRRGSVLALVAAVLAVVGSLASVDAADQRGDPDGRARPERSEQQADRAEARDRPAIRQANGGAEPDPSLTDRIEEAASDLLDFLG